MLKPSPLSQYLDVSDPDWQTRACGIIALKMVLDSLNYQTPSADKMIAEGLKQEAYLPGIGWKHVGLANLAKFYGAQARNYDWLDLSLSEAEKELTKYLGQTPILASIFKQFEPDNPGGHLIVLIGLENNRIIYADPEIKDHNKIICSIKKEKFLQGWKRRVIVVT
ncbi:MAG: hypothetical protein COX02_01645 [Candidatus Vogelbacteria bacterium CG22_combo_CG10-13_8_21_14_all_37_9]|uniref:Peptidase C39 domain-containing protein n=1 Tax=Candidatus Vogelbacteria bacterium CG22_combo_CG10-13_8_21_14_all_37_9 TaxID=1975046 RepID=A0A2H0BKN3_9BACT|nr:MAG: hypothetical protein COX02_01645 [Candidatus Vogelbacteria bacterium CG22_combo_CG10-13_8_21_14_all_37_9]